MKVQIYTATVTVQLSLDVVATDAEHAKLILDRAIEEEFDPHLNVDSAPMAAAMKIRKTADRRAAVDAVGCRWDVVATTGCPAIEAWIDGDPLPDSVDEVGDDFFPAEFGPDAPSVYATWASPPPGTEIVRPIEFHADADGRLISSDGLVEQAS